MSPDVVKQCLESVPFVPFSLSLTDRRDFRVGSSAEAELTPDGSALRFKFANGHVFVALAHVISVTLESRSGDRFGFGSKPTN
jgi:hypothetical protein